MPTKLIRGIQYFQDTRGLEGRCSLIWLQLQDTLVCLFYVFFALYNYVLEL